jgi:hypothetical protein
MISKYSFFPNFWDTELIFYFQCHFLLEGRHLFYYGLLFLALFIENDKNCWLSSAIDCYYYLSSWDLHCLYYLHFTALVLFDMLLFTCALFPPHALLNVKVVLTNDSHFILFFFMVVLVITWLYIQFINCFSLLFFFHSNISFAAN